jgi:hypothetical protein
MSEEIKIRVWKANPSHTCETLYVTFSTKSCERGLEGSSLRRKFMRTGEEGTGSLSSMSY